MMDPIIFLKLQIQAQKNIPIAQQCLMFGGRELNDAMRVRECNVQSGTVVSLVCVLCSVCCLCFVLFLFAQELNDVKIAKTVNFCVFESALLFFVECTDLVCV